MNNYMDIFRRMKSFLAFDDRDVANLSSLAPIVDRHGAAVTDHFYEQLKAEPETAAQIEGRVDRLKQTHREWMMGLVSGRYGEEYFASRWRIGTAHVRIGLAPYWVEATMSVVRTGLITALAGEIASPIELAAKSASLIKICDLDLVIINLSYTEERLERLTSFTGMKRSLLENIIKLEKR